MVHLSSPSAASGRQVSAKFGREKGDSRNHVGYNRRCQYCKRGPEQIEASARGDSEAHCSPDHIGLNQERIDSLRSVDHHSPYARSDQQQDTAGYSKECGDQKGVVVLGYSTMMPLISKDKGKCCGKWQGVRDESESCADGSEENHPIGSFRRLPRVFAIGEGCGLDEPPVGQGLPFECNVFKHSGEWLIALAECLVGTQAIGFVHVAAVAVETPVVVETQAQVLL